MNDDDDDEDVFVLCDDTVQKCDFESHVFCGVILLTKKDAKKKCVLFANFAQFVNISL